jgi:hypothetical protein
VLLCVSILLLSISRFCVSYGVENASPCRMKQNPKQRKVCHKKHQKGRDSHKKQKFAQQINVQKKSASCETR